MSVVDTILMVIKFLLGGLIVLFAILDVDAQPFMVILGLLLMGVLTVDQFYDWFPRHDTSDPAPHDDMPD